jgi:hypothetical protein
MWGFHFTFGPPFLTEDSVIKVAEPSKVLPHDYGKVGPVRRVDGVEEFAWPIGRSSEGRTIDFSQLPARETPSEMLYIYKSPSGWYRVETQSKSMAVEVRWDNTLFPYLWYWQEYGYSKEAPWYGKHYNIGLEPFSSYPTSGIAQAIKNGTALTFEAFETKTQVLSYELFPL